MENLLFNNIPCPAQRLLGRGKGGYSYLVTWNGVPCVLKQIHHEPCDYYTFGDKLQSELTDYQRLTAAGIPVPELLAVDEAGERILKAYVEGPTIMELLDSGERVDRYIPQVRQMAEQAKSHGLNIDYYPTNFVVHDGALIYIDYECNAYMDEWSFDNWGMQHWTR